VAFPTDTVYGVGAHAFNPRAVAGLFQAKLRPIGKPIALLIAPEQRLEELARVVPLEVSLLAERFWPGGLTITLLKTEVIPDVVSAGGPTVALRVPNHPVTLALIRQLGVPLAATSANLSGRPSAITAEDAYFELGQRISVVLDGGRCPGGVESTVLDLTGSAPRILRLGAIPRAEIEAALGRTVEGV
jgi:L-threonylcarbamoyladenylate synthase